MRTIQRYGWKRSHPDFRDKIADTSGLDILDEVDPRPMMPPIYDQGQLGSCTANAVAGAMQYDLHLDGEPLNLHRPSRLMLYYMERMIEGSLGQGDTGAFGRDGFKALSKYGWVPEREWRYDINKYAVDPPAPLWSEAATRLLTKPYAVVPQTEQDIKAALSNNQTVAFGFTVYESFEYQETLDTGIVPMPSRNESQLGGHEVLLVGYLAEQPDYALVRNSWGKSVYQGVPGAETYGGGYFLIPWSYILDPNLTDDLRTIVRATT